MAVTFAVSIVLKGLRLGRSFTIGPSVRGSRRNRLNHLKERASLLSSTPTLSSKRHSFVEPRADLFSSLPAPSLFIEHTLPTRPAIYLGIYALAQVVSNTPES
jgi:hypothetical protein